MPSFGEGWNLRWLLIILMDSTFLKQNTKTSINLRESNNNNRKKQTNNKTGNSVSASTLFCSRTFVDSPRRRFVFTHTPIAWFPLYLWDSRTRLLFLLISTKSRMIILGPYSDDFTHNSLCPQKVLGTGKPISMPLCQAFVDFPFR